MQVINTAIDTESGIGELCSDSGLEFFFLFLSSHTAWENITILSEICVVVTDWLIQWKRIAIDFSTEQNEEYFYYKT